MAISWKRKELSEIRWCRNNQKNSKYLKKCEEKKRKKNKQTSNFWISLRFVFLGEFVLNFSLSNAALRGSHDLSARRARRTNSSRPEGPPTRSWSPTGPWTSSTQIKRAHCCLILIYKHWRTIRAGILPVLPAYYPSIGRGAYRWCTICGMRVDRHVHWCLWYIHNFRPRHDDDNWGSVDKL